MVESLATQNQGHCEFRTGYRRYLHSRFIVALSSHRPCLSAQPTVRSCLCSLDAKFERASCASGHRRCVSYHYSHSLDIDFVYRRLCLSERPWRSDDIHDSFYSLSANSEWVNGHPTPPTRILLGFYLYIIWLLVRF